MNEDPLLLGELRTFFVDRTSRPRNICSLETYSLNNVSGSFFYIACAFFQFQHGQSLHHITIAAWICHLLIAAFLKYLLLSFITGTQKPPAPAGKLCQYQSGSALLISYKENMN